jgi:branched-chain amino acid aminotransferase
MPDMPQRVVYYNGQLVPESEARISIYDSALMFGDMVFEMTRSFNKVQFMLREHLERMYRGIKQLQIPLQMTIAEMEQAIYHTVEANEPAFEPHDEHRLMIDVSRGPLGMYKMVFGGVVKPTVIIADFPVKWTVASLAHFTMTAYAITSARHSRPADRLRSSRSRAACSSPATGCLTSDPNAMALLLDQATVPAQAPSYGARRCVVDARGTQLRGTRRLSARPGKPTRHWYARRTSIYTTWSRPTKPFSLPRRSRCCRLRRLTA